MKNFEVIEQKVSSNHWRLNRIGRTKEKLNKMDQQMTRWKMLRIDANGCEQKQITKRIKFDKKPIKNERKRSGRPETER